MCVCTCVAPLKNRTDVRVLSHPQLRFWAKNTRIAKDFDRNRTAVWFVVRQFQKSEFLVILPCLQSDPEKRIVGSVTGRTAHTHSQPISVGRKEIYHGKHKLLRITHTQHYCN